MLIIYRKILLILIIFSFNNISFAKENSCNKSLYNEQLHLKSIEIKVNDYRGWQVNNIRILTDNTYLIPKNLKKTFLSKITFFYKDNIFCTYDAKIRTHGNFKDHIIYKGGNVFQSLDVRLIDGNINNITKFKIFLKETRGDHEDEIFMTELLRELGYIAPRTQMVDVKFNNQNLEMIFQEKITKELLEYHNRREGPILEGDEKYMMKFASKVENNPNINWPEIHKQFKLGKKIQLSKQTNSSWAAKNDKFAITSFNALSKLNYIYLVYLYNFSFDNDDFSILNFNMNNYLLAEKSKEKELKLNIFNNLILSANGHHMLYGNNRKFYWNSFEGYFEPIYYDGDLIIDKKFKKLSPPFSSNYDESVEKTKFLISGIDKDKFYKKLELRNLQIDRNKFDFKLAKIDENLGIINELFKKEKKKESFNKNIPKFEELVKTYFNNLNEQKKHIRFVKYNTDSSNSNISFLLCEKNNMNCEQSLKLDKVSMRNLLEGNLILNEIDHQYFGDSNPILRSYKKILLKNEYFNNVSFYYNENIDFEFDENNKIFSIYQKEKSGRAFFLNGSINNVTIKFIGKENFFKNRNSYKYDHRTLTGCLSLIQLNINNLKLAVNNSNCEDGINIINSNGKITHIKSENSLFDGIDLDFSNLKIENLDIKNSRNDCIDFSGGRYIVQKSDLSRCGDKAISVGEKTLIELGEANISYANTGIASKDSSKTIVNNSTITNTKDCLAAYNKKQEFNGGVIEIKNSICKNFYRKKVFDKFSKIELEKDL